MNRWPRYLLLLLLTTLLNGCATTPDFDTTGIATSLTPHQVSTGDTGPPGSRVLWGGIIIASHNLNDATQLEILAYPLDSRQRPALDAQPLGRFLATRAGYLETTDFAPGRLVSLSGTLEENQQGRIGEHDYRYPVVAIDQLHLWPASGGDSETRFHFGIGVMLHN